MAEIERRRRVVVEPAFAGDDEHRAFALSLRLAQKTAQPHVRLALAQAMQVEASLNLDAARGDALQPFAIEAIASGRGGWWLGCRRRHQRLPAAVFRRYGHRLVFSDAHGIDNWRVVGPGHGPLARPTQRMHALDDVPPEILLVGRQSRAAPAAPIRHGARDGLVAAGKLPVGRAAGSATPGFNPTVAETTGSST